MRYGFGIALACATFASTASGEPSRRESVPEWNDDHLFWLGVIGIGPGGAERAHFRARE
jgi:hypothetical protein